MTADIAWAEILNIAKNAPSGGNTQPWIVQVLDDTVWVMLDNSVISNDENFTYLGALFSLGALSYNIQMAANSLGHITSLTFIEQPPFKVEIKITGYNSALKNEDNIKNIQNRCTNRKPTSNTIPEETLYRLEKELDEFLDKNKLPSFKLIRTRNTNQMQQIAIILSELERLRFSNKQTREQFFLEIKCKEEEYTDKIALKTLGLPFVMEKLMCAMIKKPAIRGLLFPKLIRAIVKRQLLKSSDIACFYSVERPSPGELIKLGYTVQFFWLQLTHYGYSMQPWTSLPFYFIEKYFDKPLTFAEDERTTINNLVKELGALLNINTMTPLFIFRMHDAPPPKYRSSKKQLI